MIMTILNSISILNSIKTYNNLWIQLMMSMRSDKPRIKNTGPSKKDSQNIPAKFEIHPLDEKYVK